MDFNHSQKISIMRVLLDIIYADSRVDYRETQLFEDLLIKLNLCKDDAKLIDKKSAILSLTDIKDFNEQQKCFFASLMDKMIKIDNDIDENEIAIYNIVFDYCKIPLPFTE
ncbi:MAG: hypothetical protein Q4E41_03330 [Bacteroidales bacterium]|nr:hypothetical protein [Bacteroidales bacterium]